MSSRSHQERFEASRLNKTHRYIGYAVGEVLLIFAGITLALAFSNWNDERQLRKLEVLALADIANNLKANADHIKLNIETDTMWVAACERFSNHISQRDLWQDSFAKELQECVKWTSPFISSAAYESLKVRGTDLITDTVVRGAIVNLYEQEYAYLLEDTDKGFWAFYEAVQLPITNQYLRKTESGPVYPNNYEELIESNEFINMLQHKIYRQNNSINEQQWVLDETERVVELINSRLSRSSL